MSEPAEPESDNGGRALSASQLLAVGALAAGGTQVDAAKAAGVTRQTISGWTRTASFRDAVEEAARDALKRVVRRVGARALIALDVLESIATNETESASARVAAASRILDAANRAVMAAFAKGEIAEVSAEERAQQIQEYLRLMDEATGPLA